VLMRRPRRGPPLAGTVYVMVRGLDNFEQGIRQSRELTKLRAEEEQIGEGLVVKLGDNPGR